LNASYDDFTVEAGTFSKSFSPGIRVGWGVVPHDLVEPLTAIKANMDFGSPNFSQQMMRCILQSGELEAHLPKIRAGYALKCQSMIDACDEYLSGVDGVHWHQPQGGLYVWLELPPSMDVGPGSEIYRRAIQQGVLYVPGQYCFPEEGVPVRRHSMRLTFGVQTPDRIRQGIRLLSEAIKHVAARL
jgi:2-aminoadipate transaminase